MTTGTLDSIRAEAREQFAKLGWPTTRLEAWKYTSLAALAKIEWRDGEAEPKPIDSPASMAGRAAVELVFVNGRFASCSGEAAGVTVRRIDTDAPLGRVADSANNAMVALNTAHANDGALIEVADRTVVDGFIHLLYIGDGDEIWSHPRNLIEVGVGSQLAVVESYVGRGRYFTNAVTELIAGDGAVIDHYRLVCESNDAFHVGNLAVQQGRSSNVTTHNVSIGGALIRSDLNIALAGEGASHTLDGLYLGSGSQHIDNHTVVDHVKPHCDSIELYKGILDDRSRGVFDGVIIVRPHAEKTVSRQTNNNLLLSETAIADSKPTLEIYNDDVKCNHGSTIGQLDDEALFYLRSRGIDDEEARRLLVYAFASEIVDRMKVEPVREQIRRAMFTQLPERMPERRGDPRSTP